MKAGLLLGECYHEMMNKSLVFLLPLIAMTFAIYLPASSGPFVYDDIKHISKNSNISEPTSLTEIIFSGKRQKRVFMNLSFGLNGWMSGKNPISYKITNIVLHIVNILIVFFLMKNLFPQKKWIPVITSALFAVHPLQAQSVSYIFGRISLLSAGITLFCFYLQSRTKEYPLKLLILIIGLSFLVKESCLALIFLCPLFEVLVKGRRWTFLKSKNAIITYSLALLMVPIFWFLKDSRSMYQGTVGFDLYPYWDHIVNQFFYYGFYIWLLVSPWSQSLMHPLRPLDTQVYLGAFAGLIFIIGFITLGMKSRKSNPMITFLTILFFVSLLPTNGPLQMINPFAEYRLYLTNFILFFIVAYYLNKYVIARSNFSINIIGVGVVLLTLAAFTFSYNKVWGKGYQVYKAASDRYPNSIRILTLSGIAFEREGDLVKAEDYYSRAVENISESNFKTANSMYRLAVVQYKQKKFLKSLQTLDKIPIDKLYNIPKSYFQLRLKIFLSIKDREKFNHEISEAQKHYKLSEFQDLILKSKSTFEVD